MGSVLGPPTCLKLPWVCTVLGFDGRTVNGGKSGLLGIDKFVCIQGGTYLSQFIIHILLVLGNKEQQAIEGSDSHFPYQQLNKDEAMKACVAYGLKTKADWFGT